MSEGEKTLYVSKEIVEKLVCDLGSNVVLDNWFDVLPNLKYLDHRNCVRWTIAAEKEDPINRKGWGLFVRTLPYVPKFLELQPSQEELDACDWDEYKTVLSEGMKKYGLEMVV